MVKATAKADGADGTADTNFKGGCYFFRTCCSRYMPLLKARQAVAYSASANLAAAASRIEDTDFAKETAKSDKVLCVKSISYGNGSSS